MDDEDKQSREMLLYNRKLKRAVLDTLFRETETFYIHCMPTPLLIIGQRGLVDGEKASTRHLSWDDSFIYCDMQFGKWEHVTIPYECIIRMFDKSNVLVIEWMTMIDPSLEEENKPELSLTESTTNEKPRTAPVINRQIETPRSENNKFNESRVIKVDFTKKKPK